MLDLLSDYLRQATTPEEKESFQVLCDALDKVGLDGYEHVIEEIIYAEDALDTGDVMFQLANLLRAQAHQVLKLHAITFDESTSLRMLGDIINGIVDLPDHEERATIVGIAGSDTNLRERFCSLMEMVTLYPPDILLQHLLTVSPGFMARLIELDEEEEQDESVVTDRREKLAVFQSFCAYLPDGMPARIGEMLNKGADVGMPYAVYAGVIGSDFEQMPPEQIAEEMYGIALVSKDGSGNPTQIIKERLEEYIANPETIVSVMAHVTKINIDFKS